MSISEGAREVCFPYCLTRRSDGLWVFLNRLYKPIGVHSKRFPSYNDVPVGVPLGGISGAVRRNLCVQGESGDEGDPVYLYNDGCVPTADKASLEAYLAKLAILISWTEGGEDHDSQPT